MIRLVIGLLLAAVLIVAGVRQVTRVHNERCPTVAQRSADPCLP
jgi:hypothetical protein